MKTTSKPPLPPPPRAAFRHALPESRLGLECQSLDEFFARRQQCDFPHLAALQSKEYTLVVVTHHGRSRILLGQKHRGFGMGMWNSFGGKIEPHDVDDTAAAMRELYEETGIRVREPRHCRRIGSLYFTFQDTPEEMIVRLFRIRIAFANDKTTETKDGDGHDENVVLLPDPSIIRGCDEITPHWFEDYHDIPLNNMFADDTVWFTALLESTEPFVQIDGHFHLHAGGQETNSLMYYYLHIQQQQKEVQQRSSELSLKQQPRSLEQRLFHRLHDNQIHSPSIKEFKEAWAFVNKVRSVVPFGGDSSIQCVIDVAGGHGALAALFLITTSAQHAIVIDPAQVGNGGVMKAWGTPFMDRTTLLYRHECLRTALPDELQQQLKYTSPDRVLVVACHACQHLSEEIVQIACRFGVHVAVMPCCQKDHSPGMSWKSTSQNLNIPIEITMDLLLAGKCMSWSSNSFAAEDNGVVVPYDVRIKMIDRAITPQNRIIIARACHHDDPPADVATHGFNHNDDSYEISTIRNPSRKQEIIEKAHCKMQRAYQKAHHASLPSSTQTTTSKTTILHETLQTFSLLGSFSSGIAVGFLVALTLLRR